MKKDIVIFDLDGTLAIIDERLKESSMKNGKINWKRFFSEDLIKKDLPNYPVVETANLFHQNGYKIYIFSGRSETTENATRKWLKDNRIQYDYLGMRKKNDYRPDEIVKKDFIKKSSILDKVFLTFDDRKKVVKMWRSLGLPCFQVSEGNF
tara:strand:- start:273 stop:725 length:453 start_codon:yes stop_codon:yes gene_type:complete